MIDPTQSTEHCAVGERTFLSRVECHLTQRFRPVRVSVIHHRHFDVLGKAECIVYDLISQIIGLGPFHPVSDMTETNLWKRTTT